MTEYNVKLEELKGGMKELREKQAAVRKEYDKISNTVAAGATLVDEMREQLAAIKAERATVTDMAAAKKLKRKETALEEKIELYIVVNTAETAENRKALQEAAEDFFQFYDEYKNVYVAADTAAVREMTLMTAKETAKEMRAFTFDSYNVFRSVVSMLKQSGIISDSDIHYSLSTGTSVHLNQSGLRSRTEGLAQDLTPLKRVYNV